MRFDTPTLSGEEERWIKANVRRCKLERRIVWNMIHFLIGKGFAIDRTDNGEDSVKNPTPVQAMEEIFAVDDSYIFFKKEGFDSHYVRLIGGNDEDIISDWSFTDRDPDGFSAAMDEFLVKVVDKLARQ